MPNGVDVSEFAPAPSAEGGASGSGTGIAFVGGTQPSPNLDALEYFCREIQPALRALAGAVPVRWIGRASPEQQQQYRERYGVELTGYVDDVRPMMQSAACHIVPLRVGGA